MDRQNEGRKNLRCQAPEIEIICVDVIMQNIYSKKRQSFKVVYSIDKGRKDTNDSGSIGDLKNNYGDYMITEPLDYNKELKRIPSADYELCTALLFMILREDHFTNGSFDWRFADDQVLLVLERMKYVLSTRV